MNQALKRMAVIGMAVVTLFISSINLTQMVSPNEPPQNTINCDLPDKTSDK